MRILSESCACSLPWYASLIFTHSATISSMDSSNFCWVSLACLAADAQWLLNSLMYSSRNCFRRKFLSAFTVSRNALCDASTDRPSVLAFFFTSSLSACLKPAISLSTSFIRPFCMSVNDFMAFICDSTSCDFSSSTAFSILSAFPGSVLRAFLAAFNCLSHAACCAAASLACVFSSSFFCKSLTSRRLAISLSSSTSNCVSSSSNSSVAARSSNVSTAWRNTASMLCASCRCLSMIMYLDLIILAFSRCKPVNCAWRCVASRRSLCFWYSCVSIRRVRDTRSRFSRAFSLPFFPLDDSTVSMCLVSALRTPNLNVSSSFCMRFVSSFCSRSKVRFSFSEAAESALPAACSLPSSALRSESSSFTALKTASMRLVYMRVSILSSLSMLASRAFLNLSSRRATLGSLADRCEQASNLSFTR
mmetsp:Transcript_2945/g.7200  ORF Transcript_2945/g.7200 Transcript_2945/m.7200 type:complete len:420 (-) Transcript_2945:181-1440(-)